MTTKCSRRPPEPKPILRVATRTSPRLAIELFECRGDLQIAGAPLRSAGSFEPLPECCSLRSVDGLHQQRACIDRLRLVRRLGEIAEALSGVPGEVQVDALGRG